MEQSRACKNIQRIKNHQKNIKNYLCSAGTYQQCGCIQHKPALLRTLGMMGATAHKEKLQI